MKAAIVNNKPFLSDDKIGKNEVAGPKDKGPYEERQCPSSMYAEMT